MNFYRACVICTQAVRDLVVAEPSAVPRATSESDGCGFHGHNARSGGSAAVASRAERAAVT